MRYCSLPHPTVAPGCHLSLIFAMHSLTFTVEAFWTEAWVSWGHSFLYNDKCPRDKLLEKNTTPSHPPPPSTALTAPDSSQPGRLMSIGACSLTATVIATTESIIDQNKAVANDYKEDSQWTRVDWILFKEKGEEHVKAHSQRGISHPAAQWSSSWSSRIHVRNTTERSGM